VRARQAWYWFSGNSIVWLPVEDAGVSGYRGRLNFWKIRDHIKQNHYILALNTAGTLNYCDAFGTCPVNCETMGKWHLVALSRSNSSTWGRELGVEY
jgi:hypothetical protein